MHEPSNRNIMKIFIENVIVYTQFTLKLNSINTVKEGKDELWIKINDENFHTVKWGTLNNGVTLNEIFFTSNKCYCLYTIYI